MAEAADAPSMRWWGWGDPGHRPALPSHALGFLGEIAAGGVARPPVALGSVRLSPSRLGTEVLAELRAIVGAEGVHDEHLQRVLHAAGKGYPDLIRLRAGEPEGAPDVVVLPSAHDQVRSVLELCTRASLAVVPFGGGTSVVGGVAPLPGDHSGVVSLDMRRMGEVLSLDRESLTVTVQAGLRAPALERHLAAKGLTLGHFPQSFEYVSLGGCAATRSAGQASSGYGAIERMILGMRFAAPEGDIELPAVPASAAGPGMRQLLIGSEGTLGVISELALRVRPAPRERVYEGVFFEDFAAGIFKIDVYAVRALALQGSADVLLLVVDTGVEAEILHQMAALLVGTRDADHPATFQLGDLADDRADRAGRRRYDDRLSGLRFSQIEQAEIGGRAGHAEHAHIGGQRRRTL